MMSTAIAVGVVGHAPPASAQGAEQKSFSVPAGPLSRALTVFGRQAGLQVTYLASIAAGKSSPGLNGSASTTQALNRILQGTGLTYSFTNATTVAVDQPARQAGAAAAIPGAINLDTINVQGDQQSATGPGVGYLATRSEAGTKSDTPIIETPQSISVVTRKQLDDQQPQTINQALRYSPGVSAETNGNTSGVSSGDITIRGFTTELYLDNLRNTYSYFMDPYLLNRVEILAGPASVLYGQASPGGLINMSSKLPTETAFHEVVLGGGSYGNLQGAFDFGGPIDKDGHFLYRLTGSGFSQDSIVDFSHQKKFSIAPAITWRPDSDTTFTILAKYINAPAIGPYIYVPAQGSVLPNPNGLLPRSFFSGDPNYNNNTRELASIGYQFDHRFDETWSFHQSFLYQHVNELQDNIQPDTLGSDSRTLSRYAEAIDDKYDTFLLDNRLAATFGTFGITHKTTFGIDYQRTLYNESFNFDYSTPSLDIFAPVYGIPYPPFDPTNLFTVNQTQEQIGVYAQDQMSWDRWRFLVGVRNDWAHDSTTNASGPTFVPSTTSNDAQKPTWRAGLVYLFDNGMAPYFSYSTSFQPQAGVTFAGTPFLPTTGQQYEAGIKYQPPGWNSFVTAAVYNLTQQNVLTPDPDPAHAGFEVQTG